MLRNYYKSMFTSKIIPVIILTWLIRQHLVVATAATGTTANILASYQQHNTSNSSNRNNSSVENIVFNTKPLISTHDQREKSGKGIVNSGNNTLADGFRSQSIASVKSSSSSSCNSLNVNKTDTQMTLKLKDATARNVYITQPAPAPVPAAVPTAQTNNGSKTVISFSSTSSVQSNYKINAESTENTQSLSNTTPTTFAAAGQLASSEIISSPETIGNNEYENESKYPNNPRSPYQITNAALNISLLMTTAATYQQQNNSNSARVHTNQAFDNKENGIVSNLITNNNLINTTQDLKVIKSESTANDADAEAVVSETGQLNETQRHEIFSKFLKDLSKKHRVEEMPNSTKQDAKFAKRKDNTDNLLKPYQGINSKVQGLQEEQIGKEKKNENLLSKQPQHRDRNENENEKQNEQGKQLSLITNLKSNRSETKTENENHQLSSAFSDAALNLLNETENIENFLKNSSKIEANEKWPLSTKQNETKHVKAFDIKSFEVKSLKANENSNTQSLSKEKALLSESLKWSNPKNLKALEEISSFETDIRNPDKILSPSNSSKSLASNIKTLSFEKKEPLSLGVSKASLAINSNETKLRRSSNESKALEHIKKSISKAFTQQGLNESKAFSDTNIIKEASPSSNEKPKTTEGITLKTAFQKELELEMKLERLKQFESKMYKKLKKEINAIKTALQKRKEIQTENDTKLASLTQAEHTSNMIIADTDAKLLKDINLKTNKSQAIANVWQRQKRLNIKSSNPDGLTNLTSNSVIPALHENFTSLKKITPNVDTAAYLDKQSITETAKSIENENKTTSERVVLETADVHKLKYFHDDANDANDVKQKQMPNKRNKTTTNAVQSLLAIDANMNNKQLARLDSNSGGVNNPEHRQQQQQERRNQTKLLIVEKYNDTDGMNDNIETTTANTEAYLSTSSADRVSVTDELRQDLWEFLTTLATADSLATTTTTTTATAAAIDLIRPTTPLFISDNLANKSTNFIYTNNTTTTTIPFTSHRPLTLSDLVNATLNPTTTMETFSSTDLMQLIATATAATASTTAQPALLTFSPLVNASATTTAITGFSTISTTTTPSWPVKHASVMEGNVILGGLMMVHSREDSITCGPIMPQGGIQALEAMLYTLDQVNKLQLLPNITLGAHILDDCDKDTYGLEMAVDFIKGKCTV